MWQMSEQFRAAVEDYLRLRWQSSSHPAVSYAEVISDDHCPHRATLRQLERYQIKVEQEVAYKATPLRHSGNIRIPAILSQDLDTDEETFQAFQDFSEQENGIGLVIYFAGPVPNEEEPLR